MSSNQNTNTDNSNMAWRPSFNPWLIALSVMLGTFMVVLDTSVANVALPNIAGSFSATTEESTWVLTSYLVATAVVLPMTAWLGNFFGRKRFFIICLVIFTISSILCGMAPNLDMMILARIVQGASGGALLPISQAILLESFPPEKRGIATAVFGLGVVVAPIIGPTLGGWLTDNFSWHWIFYINIPFGILATLLSQMFIEDPPYIKRSQGKIDYIGFTCMAVWLVTLQIILDKGQHAEWFASTWIKWFALISFTSMVLFIFRELKCKEPIVDLKIFADRNFTIGSILSTAVGAVLYGTLAMLPIFLQNLMHYPASQSGIAISPRGIGSLLTVAIAGALSNKIDDRILIAAGFGLLGFSCLMLGDINYTISMDNIIWPNIINGFALGFIFIPLTTATFATLKNHQLPHATGIFNLMRSIGGSIGISAVATLLSNNAQVHQAAMISHLTPYDAVYQQKLQSTIQFLSSKVGHAEAVQQAQAMMYGTLVKQAHLWAFVDNFRLFALLCFLLVPTILLFKKGKAQGHQDVAMH